MEIGVHFISIMLTDFISTPLWNCRITIEDSIDPEVYISKAETLIVEAMHISEEKELALKGLGVAIWGMVNSQSNVIHFAPNLNWHDVSLKTRWMDLFNIPVFIENDANASALGEYYFGNGQGIEDFLYLSMDIGVGAGIIANGRLFRGFSGYAGEIGHVTIDPKGALCNCGKRGCLETEIGRLIIVEQYKELTHCSNISLEQIIERGQAGDLTARKIFRDAGIAIGIGISAAINLLNPGAIIFGWSLGKAYNLILPGIERSLRERCFPDFCDHLQLKPSLMGPHDAVYGSIALVLDEIIREKVNY
jgi:predicted NBD/HSP70 family sugar kinase